MKSSSVESAIVELNVDNLEFVTGAGFWRDLGYQTAELIEAGGQLVGDGIQAVYNIGTRGYP